ncbi:unnamed protein product (macronuclear) [Paramecium tetraurelia]|uniref:Uncharacterized protein n=1 Tax=Paramecium tetraurelia TaxID=5888 RepID=A0DU06_PARTE|nr:uncharacterized protein GSPATT00020207001 [Paramecium tetraurelia]CAK86523.1 unnamed protein product [Paramecium tetraurelia]|eukprot:XP_001453920.1 hypothetical protein (macronuclear) [Paramecium tetraurelia strain d4-2]
MGNQEGICCLQRDKEYQVLNNELVIFREYQNIKITVKLGDIQNESAESVICLYTNPEKIPLQPSYTQQVYDNLCKIGYENVYSQNLDMSNYKCITYYRVRAFESEKDLFQYYNGFKECLTQLNDDQYKEILICDCPIKQSRSISSEILVRSVIDFIEESNNRLHIKSITLMNCDKKCSLVSSNMNQSNKLKSRNRQNKFMKFITSTKSEISEMGRQNKCDFSLKDFDLGDESKLMNMKEEE